MNHAENNKGIIHGSLRAACCFLVLALVGCGDVGNRPNTSSSPSQVEATLIDEPSRTHDFGSVVSRSGRTLVHRYRLNNTTGRDVKIVEVVNRKPCCGTVGASKTVLHPGEGADVEVVLSVGGRFGDVVHNAAVVTDQPSQSEIALQTIAHTFPPVRFEEGTASRESVLTSAVEPLAVEFRVVAHGTRDDPPVDLDRLELGSTIAVRWSGPKEDGAVEDGLQVESRRFVAMLDRAGMSGARAAEVVLREGQEIQFRHALSWEVVAPISVSPKMVVLSGQHEYRVVLRSQDGKAFRVTGIDCPSANVLCRGTSREAGLTQALVIEVEDANRAGSGRAIIAVRTDHPSQGQVQIPIVALD
jgi:hypothetical protein